VELFDVSVRQVFISSVTKAESTGRGGDGASVPGEESRWEASWLGAAWHSRHGGFNPAGRRLDVGDEKVNGLSWARKILWASAIEK
jgi:hypothetical protein